MKRVVLTALLFSVSAFGAEVGEGQWSETSPILKITSYWSFTAFKLNGTDGCGSLGDGDWRLNTSGTTTAEDRALDYKKSMLLAAYMAGKSVRLRCQSGAISDLSIEN